MKVYTARTTFSGYKLGYGNPNMYVGVPDTIWTGEKIRVEHKRQLKDYVKDDVVGSNTFDHKNKPGTYKLLYVLWEEIEP